MKKVTHNQIAETLYETLKDKTGASFENALKQSVNFLYKRKLLSKSRQIFELVSRVENKKSGKIEVSVLSASPLSSDLKSSLSHVLKEKYASEFVCLKEIIKPELKGGLVLIKDDEMIDMSFLGRIRNFENYLISKI